MKTLPTVSSATVFSKRIEHHCVIGEQGERKVHIGNEKPTAVDISKPTLILLEKSTLRQSSTRGPESDKNQQLTRRTTTKM